MLRILQLALGILALAGPAAAQTESGPDPELDAALRYLDSLGLPVAEEALFVEATTGEQPQGVAVHGFLAEDRGETFTVWVSVPVGWPGFPRPHHATGHPLARWTLRRTSRGTPSERRIGYEAADLVALARRALRSHQDAEKAHRYPPSGLSQDERVFCARGLYATELCMLAWAVHRREPAQQKLAHDLLEAARELYPRTWYRPDPPTDLRGYLEIDLGHAAFWELLEDFADRRVTRTELRARAETINRLYPRHPHRDRATELERLLRESLRSARTWPSLDGVDRLVDIDTRARALVFHLQDQNGIQLEQPGGPDIWADPRGERSPAHRLLALGIDAVPALLDAVGDPRPSRTVRFVRNHSFSHHVLRVGDIAWTVLREIAGRGFADLDAARTWYAEIRSRGYETVLAEATATGSQVGVVQGAILRDRAPSQAPEHLIAGATRAGEDAVRARYLALLIDDLDDPQVQGLLSDLLDDPDTGPRSRLTAALLAARSDRDAAAHGLETALRDGLRQVHVAGVERARPRDPESATLAGRWLLLLHGDRAVDAFARIDGERDLAPPPEELVGSLSDRTRPVTQPLPPAFTEPLGADLAPPDRTLEAASEAVLRLWVRDPRPVPDSEDRFGPGDVPPIPSVADLAAQALARTWPVHYHYSAMADGPERATQRAAILRTPARIPRKQ